MVRLRWENCVRKSKVKLLARKHGSKVYKFEYFLNIVYCCYLHRIRINYKVLLELRIQDAFLPRKRVGIKRKLVHIQVNLPIVYNISLTPSH